MDAREFARYQRQRSTSSESAMWSMLRNRGVLGKKFRRQHTLGPYTADFFCASERIDVEIDGASHFTPEGRARDAIRDAWMHAHGIRVLRFTGQKVENEMHLVRAEIEQALRTPQAENENDRD